MTPDVPLNHRARSIVEFAVGVDRIHKRMIDAINDPAADLETSIAAALLIVNGLANGGGEELRQTVKGLTLLIAEDFQNAILKASVVDDA